MSTSKGWQCAGVLLVVFGLGLIVGPATATAGSNEALDEVLGEIEWGDNKEKVLEKLKSQMFEAMRQRADVQHDRVKLQKVRKRMVDKFETIKESYTELKGEKTGYEVSVISGEYTKDNNEDVLVVDDDAAKRYYFFADGQFYKMVVAYRQSYLDGVGFEAFIGQVSGKYGNPGETTRRKIGGERTLATAAWKDSTTLLTAKNHKEFFGTFAMVFSDRKRIEEMRANNEDFGGSNKDGLKVSDRVEGLKEDSGRDENSDVVDGMLGEKVEVDISHQEDLNEQGPTGEASKTEEEKAKEAQAAESSGGEESSGASGQQQASEDDQDERDFSDLSSSSDKKEENDQEDDELIIY